MQKPLTSLMAIGEHERHATPKQLRGQDASARPGIPYQSAYLKTILDTAGVDPGSVKEINVGFNLVPAMISKKVDATLGAFWNYEGVDLAAPRPQAGRSCGWSELGVPTYNELVFVARREDLDEAGALAACAASCRPPRAATRWLKPIRRPASTRCSEADTELDRGLQTRRREGHAAGVLPAGRATARSAGRTRARGTRYEKWMRANELLKRPRRTSGAADQRVPAGRGAGPGDEPGWR